MSQMVYGELVILRSLVRNVSVKSPSFSVDRTDHLKLFRRHVSRTAAGKGRAVLEGVELDTATITACIKGNPLDEEEAVQSGLTKWSGGQGLQPPTWEVLLDAMEYAQISQQHINDLKTALGLH
ncbi:MAG: hypothetical protein MPL62_16410 [Alphaproteobacteria bacterium]|nr:hypothetical protein [Alphaproteobacteria bacterium]